jgi:hypothetical protein
MVDCVESRIIPQRRLYYRTTPILQLIRASQLRSLGKEPRHFGQFSHLEFGFFFSFLCGSEHTLVCPPIVELSSMWYGTFKCPLSSLNLIKALKQLYIEGSPCKVQSSQGFQSLARPTRLSFLETGLLIRYPLSI